MLALAVSADAAHADRVELTNGDVLIGEITAREDASVTLDHPVLGEIVLPRDKIASVSVDGTTPAEQAAETTDGDTPPEEPAESAPDDDPAAEAMEDSENGGLFGTSLLRGWDKRLELGFSGQAGNSDTADVYLRARADFENERKRWKFDASYYYGQSDGETDENEAAANLRRDWLVPNERHFYFAGGGYEFDEFEAWDHRVRGNGGIGYAFYKREDFTLNGRAGLGAVAEFGGDQDDEVVPEALLGLELSWDIGPGQVLTASNVLYPQLEDVGEFRNATAVEYLIELDRQDGMSIKFGVENEYDSTDDDNRNDVKYYGALVLDF